MAIYFKNGLIVISSHINVGVITKHLRQFNLCTNCISLILLPKLNVLRSESKNDLLPLIFRNRGNRCFLYGRADRGRCTRTW